MTTRSLPIETLMDEIRQGLRDTTLTQHTQDQIVTIRNLEQKLDKTTEYAPLLGRCGGSLRGRLCRLFAKPAKPVVEQIDLFHAHVVEVLKVVSESVQCQRRLEERIAQLETRVNQMPPPDQ